MLVVMIRTHQVNQVLHNHRYTRDIIYTLYTIGIIAIKPGDFNSKLLGTEKHLLVLEIIATTSSNYLQWMKDTNENSSSSIKPRPGLEWYDKPEVVAVLRDRVVSFLAYAQENKESSEVEYVVTCHRMKYTDNDKVSIKLLTNGKIEKKFHLPGSPRGLKVEFTSSKGEFHVCKLTWEKPPKTELEGVKTYVAEYKGYTDENLDTVGPGAKDAMDVNPSEVTATFDKVKKGLFAYEFTVRARCQILQGLCQKAGVFAQVINLNHDLEEHAQGNSEIGLHEDFERIAALLPATIIGNAGLYYGNTTWQDQLFSGRQSRPMEQAIPFRRSKKIELFPKPWIQSPQQQSPQQQSAELLGQLHSAQQQSAKQRSASHKLLELPNPEYQHGFV